VVVPLILLCLGIQIGRFWERQHRRSAVPQADAAAVDPPAPVPPEAAVTAPPAPPSGQVSVEVAGSFQNNLYPSLILSLGSAYPAYSRCLAVRIRNASPSKTLQVKVDSALFQQALILSPPANSANFSVNPDLPWNFTSLRQISQDRPETFVVSLIEGDHVVAQSSIVCLVHAVNQVVTRVLNTSNNQWQDTSVCVAALVNEGSQVLGPILQEAIAGGSIQAFTGYEFGPVSAGQQVHAIWDALAARGMSYVNISAMTSPTPGITTQSVRSVEQTLHDQGANCVDASVLFASLLRKIGLRPVLVFKPGHCLVAYYDAQENGNLIALETTLLNAGSYASALSTGQQELQDSAPYFGQPDYSSVDIGFARQQGVVPIPSP
jgi:hypothetical protein